MKIQQKPELIWSPCVKIKLAQDAFEYLSFPALLSPLTAGSLVQTQRWEAKQLSLKENLVFENEPAVRMFM